MARAISLKPLSMARQEGFPDPVAQCLSFHFWTGKAEESRKAGLLGTFLSFTFVF
jgi:hypothetical protein